MVDPVIASAVTGACTLIAGIGGVVLAQRTAAVRERERHQQESRTNSYVALLAAVQRVLHAKYRRYSLDPNMSLSEAETLADFRGKPSRYLGTDDSEVVSAAEDLARSAACVQLLGTSEAASSARKIRDTFKDGFEKDGLTSELRDAITSATEEFIKTIRQELKSDSGSDRNAATNQGPWRGRGRDKRAVLHHPNEDASADRNT